MQRSTEIILKYIRSVLKSAVLFEVKCSFKYLFLSFKYLLNCLFLRVHCTPQGRVTLSSLTSSGEIFQQLPCFSPFLLFKFEKDIVGMGAWKIRAKSGTE